MTSLSVTKTKSPDHILLEIRGCGNIVSFKNSKMIARGRLITDPKKQKKMESYIQSIASRLRSLFQTSGGETGMGCSLASWIQSSMPLDDSRQWISELRVDFRDVPEGNEGATIIIEKL